MGKTNIIGQAQATAAQDAARLAAPAIHGAVVAGGGRIRRKGDGSIWH